MNKPFDYIQDTTVYSLKWSRYGYGAQRNNTIEKCITDTATYYNQEQIEPAVFSSMIDKITQGSHSSPIAHCGCVNATVQAICIYFPLHLTITNVTKLIKCFRATDTLAVDYIQDTGYKFTSSQYKTLNNIGMIMLNKMDNITLSEFYSFFSNESFREKITKQWNVDPNLYDTVIPEILESIPTNSQSHINNDNHSDNQNNNQTEICANDSLQNNFERESTIEQVKKPEETMKKVSKIVYPQYLELKSIIDKFNIKLDSEFWIHIISSLPIREFTIKSFLNLHRVVIALGCKPNNDILKDTLKSHNINECDKETVAYFDEILQFYSDISFDRSDIITYDSNFPNINFSNIKLILKSKFCSYDPMIDLYYWMYGSSLPMKNYLIDRIIANKDQDLYMHLFSLSYIKFDHFCRYIETYPECGWDDKTFIKIALSFHPKIEMIQYYVDNKLIVNLDILDYMRDNESIKRIYQTCTSYDEQAFDRILDLEYEKAESSQIRFIKSHCTYAYRVYRSMTPRDRRIMTDCDMRGMQFPLVSISLILKYDIHITKKHLEYMLSCGYEEIAITLIHISRKYYYLIDYIDIDMALKCYNYLPRMWFYRNIVIPKTVDSIKTSEFNFCLYDKSEQFIFNVKMNDREDSDLPITMKDRIEEIAQTYEKNIQEVQEYALNRILKT